MRLRNTILFAFMLVVGNTSLSVKSAVGQTRLGLHVTQEELNIWKTRAASGPYKSQWDTIKSRADGFLSSPPAMWTARTTGGCWNENGTDTTPGRSLDREARDAGLMYLISGNTAYRDAVRTRLLAQIAVAGTNFATNTGVWCNSNNFEERYFEISNWVRRLVYAYDYIRPSLSPSDVSAIDAWFLGAANHFDNGMNITMGWRFSGRLSDDYTCTGGTTFCPGGAKGTTHFGGPTVYAVNDGWNNILDVGAAVIAAIGIQQNNATLKSHAKRFFTEWLKYAVWSSGVHLDQYRWNGYNGQIGYLYAGTSLGAIITIADHFARTGDTSLYDMTTEEGISGSESPGAPKSLRQVMQHFAGLTNGTVLNYASTVSTSDAALLIDPYSGGAENYITFVTLAPANIYYQDAAVRTAYMSTIPASQGTGDYDALGGEWGEYPMALAMFGQMEGQVNPYGATTTTTTTPPSSSGVTVDTTYTGYTTIPIDDGVINAAGGTATTWASAESTVDPHWITITLSSPKQLNTATIYWAYNNDRQAYMTSQQVDFQYWNGSSFQTAGSFIYTADLPSSTITFPSVTTSQIRFYQPANKGNPQYPTVLWVTEVDYGNNTSLQPPAAPSGLVTVIQ